MTKRCIWCGNDILDHRESTVFLGRSIHDKCLKIMKNELKKAGWMETSENEQRGNKQKTRRSR